MVEHTVQEDPDPVLVERPAHIPEVFIGAQPAVDLLVIPCVVTVCIRFKDRAEVDSGNSQLFQMGDPVLYFQDPVRLHTVVLIRRAAHAQRIDLIDHTFFSPHN